MELVAKLSGKPPKLSRYAVRLVGRQYHYSTVRMQEEMEFTPEVGLKDGIRRILSSKKAEDIF
jgi:nucleoside-diphosphate-sugar epimerase